MVASGEVPPGLITWPRVPGHEFAGTVHTVGDGVSQWKEGDRVGVAFYGDACGSCGACVQSLKMSCPEHKGHGCRMDGGYAEYACVKASLIARVPDGLALDEIAPAMCAGVTVFNGLRNSNASPGDLVVIQGLGGLGHLGVQFARKMGFRVVAVSMGDCAAAAKELGAEEYIDAATEDVTARLQAMGGANAILATAPSCPAIGPLADGIAPGGTLVAIGVGGGTMDVTIGVVHLIIRGVRLIGSQAGDNHDCERTMRFMRDNAIRVHCEKYKFDDVKPAFDRMMSGQARYRVVLTMQ